MKFERKLQALERIIIFRRGGGNPGESREESAGEHAEKSNQQQSTKKRGEKILKKTRDETPEQRKLRKEQEIRLAAKKAEREKKQRRGSSSALAVPSSSSPQQSPKQRRGSSSALAVPSSSSQQQSPKAVKERRSSTSKKIKDPNPEKVPEAELEPYTDEEILAFQEKKHSASTTKKWEKYAKKHFLTKFGNSIDNPDEESAELGHEVFNVTKQRLFVDYKWLSKFFNALMDQPESKDTVDVADRLEALTMTTALQIAKNFTVYFTDFMDNDVAIKMWKKDNPAIYAMSAEFEFFDPVVKAIVLGLRAHPNFEKMRTVRIRIFWAFVIFMCCLPIYRGILANQKVAEAEKEAAK